MPSITSTDHVLQHHLAAFAENNIEEIMKDYNEESVVCTPEGKLTGLAAIRSFYSEVFKFFPVGKTNLEVKQKIIEKGKAYIAWTADSPVAEVPLGTDSFEINEGKIIWQSLAAHITFK